MKLLEHDIQAAYFDFISWEINRDSRYDAIYAVPNAGKRSVGALLYYKAEGLRSGVPDVCIPVPVKPYCGAYIEFKRPGEKQTQKQIEWFIKLTNLGHKCVVCYDATVAYEWTKEYFRGEE